MGNSFRQRSEATADLVFFFFFPLVYFVLTWVELIGGGGFGCFSIADTVTCFSAVRGFTKQGAGFCLKVFLTLGLPGSSFLPEL